MTLIDQFATLPTPLLLVDEAKMTANIARLRDRPVLSSVALRPHLKTAKSVDIARRMLASPTGPATVSTLREAVVFFQAGVTDILYAVGISPQKLPRAAALRRAGCDLTVILDSPAQAEAATGASRAHHVPIPALVEIDSDGHRGSLPPDDPALVEVGRRLHEGGLLRGVLTHAGESYAVAGRKRMPRGPSASGARRYGRRPACGGLACRAPS